MEFIKQTKFYRGKVRDVHTIADKYLVMIASDRISAFDHILPKEIPYKGQILNQIAYRFLKDTSSIVKNWLIESPLPNVSIGHLCEPIPLEMVIRGNMTGHAARTYKSGKRTLCGVNLPEGMREHDFFPEPIITPATKANEGHDEDISRDEILERNIVSEEDYALLEKYTRELFNYGKEYAQKLGLILVDTKYEFGKLNNEIVLMDEIHTPDSSRYFYADTYEEYQKKGIPQRQLSKEFVREWLIEHDFQGLEGQKMPEIPDEFINIVTARYIELFEKVMNEKFEMQMISDKDIENKVNTYLSKLNIIT